MDNIGRRKFLSLVSGSAAGIISLPITSGTPPLFAKTSATYGSFDKYAPDVPNKARACWLDLCAPFVVEDTNRGLHSEIVLTSDTFVGSSGHVDGLDATEYELYLYDASGGLIGPGGVTAKLRVPAMHTTTIAVRDLIGPRKSFWGGLTIRLRPSTRQPMHATDLFSSAFVRWRTDESFTNVHANPDPLQWQRPDSFFYSIPFPPLRNYECVYSVFNPYAERSAGSLLIYDPFGAKLRELPFDLEPHSSVLLNLQDGEFTRDADNVAATRANRSSSSQANRQRGALGGTVAVVNRKGSVKNFGYLLIKQKDNTRFSMEHPIHQPPYDPLPATPAFDTAGRLKAKNVLYTPLLFADKKIGGITLGSRFHLSSGAPMERLLRMSPFITDEKGVVVWQPGNHVKYPASIPEHQIENDVITLGPYQSCVFDCRQIGLRKGFSGGFSLAVAPNTNHTLMKVEILVSEWNATAFTHFRPGLAAARMYQKPQARGGLATDYVATGARLEFNGRRILRDEIIAIINVDDKNVSGNPFLEVFSSNGYTTGIKVGNIPAFSCGHYLLSQLLSESIGAHDLTFRLIDERATLLMSIVHLDYDRRDIALDHGSDRFSTFSEFTCDPKA